jgi:hypothetical protein
MMSSSDRKRRVLRCGQMGLTELLAAIVICLFYAKTVEEPRRLESQLKEIQSALSTLDELAAALFGPAHAFGHKSPSRPLHCPRLAISPHS